MGDDRGSEVLLENCGAASDKDGGLLLELLADETPTMAVAISTLLRRAN